ncbi:uncharacterized protein C8R40DRAFT_1237929 [Lentinula edodes]|uniref:uncharacterized protein n=1 Tax=Lentinula edodes TaxID=5353 RepID=UPI001E8CB8FC|nr:uncharacterized protein C8R40DRAFT_1237929 [Lentinula edodes]KAH7874514.1 hypothetical protein C8R40DRAFT_1237929 [Lentinula edodes]
MASQQQSGPLSDADIYALQEWIAETAVGFCLYGIYATFSFIAIYFLLTRHGGDATKKARLVLLTVIIFMFINSTSLVILDLEYILVQIPLGSFNPPDIQKTTKILGNIKISGNFLERLNFLINDGIVVWRAWILFPRNWHIKLLLGFCLLACGVCNVFDAASGAVNVLKNYQAVGAGTKEFLVLTLPLLVTNIVATFLIGYCHALTTTNQSQHHPTCFLTPPQDIRPPQDRTTGTTHLPKTGPRVIRTSPRLS